MFISPEATGEGSWSGAIHRVRLVDDELVSQTFRFTGSFGDGQLTLDSAFEEDWPDHITGVLDDGSVALLMPRADGAFRELGFHPSTLAEYNDAVMALQTTVAQERQRAEDATATALSAVSRFYEAAEEAYRASCADHDGVLDQRGRCLVFYPGGSTDGDFVAIRPDGSWDEEMASRNRQTCDELARAGFNAQFHEDTGVCVPDAPP